MENFLRLCILRIGGIAAVHSTNIIIHPRAKNCYTFFEFFLRFPLYFFGKNGNFVKYGKCPSLLAFANICAERQPPRGAHKKAPFCKGAFGVDFYYFAAR